MANNLTFRNFQFILDIMNALFMLKYQLVATVFFEISYFLCICYIYRRAFTQLSVSPEAFLTLRGHLQVVMRVCAYVSTFWVLGIAICQTSWLTWKLEE